MLALAYVLVLAIVALGVPLALTLADRVDAEIRSQARSQADIVAAASTELVGAGRRRDLRVLADRAARSSRGRVVVVDAAGRVLVDSAGRDSRGLDFSNRPEVAAALAGRASSRRRDSATLGQPLLATAVPIVRHGRPAGAVRVTQSVEAARRAVRRQIAGIALIGLLVLITGLGAGLVIARRIAGPLRRLDMAARRVAGGDLEARAPVEGSAEQRSLASSFNDMTERLADTLQSQQRFVADASHQLRTPLSGLRLRLEEAEASSAEEATDHLEAGMREVDRLARTVDELLALSQAEQRKVPGGEVGTAEAGRRAIERWGAYASERGIHLELAVDPGIVWSAAPDLDLALDALLENALNYSSTGTAVTVAVSGPAIEVRDRGPGLAPGEAEQVFARFRRGRTGIERAQGSGLGLPIARELARRWGGEVTLSSRAGGGTTARLELPPFANPLPGGH